MDANKTRAKVIEKGVDFELSITMVLAFLLDINLESSKILGDSSQALPINSKFKLLNELNITPPEIKAYCSTFVEIRNKFAHVKACDSFTYYFDNYANATEKKKFLALFAGDKPDIDMDEESRLYYSFETLCLSISIWLSALIKIEGDRKKSNDKKDAIIEMLRDFQTKKIRSLQEYSDFHSYCSKFVDDIPVHQEFKELIDNNKKTE